MSSFTVASKSSVPQLKHHVLRDTGAILILFFVVTLGYIYFNHLTWDEIVDNFIHTLDGLHDRTFTVYAIITVTALVVRVIYHFLGKRGKDQANWLIESYARENQDLRERIKELHQRDGLVDVILNQQPIKEEAYEHTSLGLHRVKDHSSQGSPSQG